MPFYTWLRPRETDDELVLRTKQRATDRLRALRAAIREHIDTQRTDDADRPPDSSRSLRIATWNIREFDSASYGWRLDEAKAYIAEIVSHFDLVAVQEVREDLAAVRDLLRLLGPAWTALATDVSPGSAGNRERMVFLYNRDRIWFRDVAGELTLEPDAQVRDPFGERFRVVGGPKLHLPAGASLEGPVDVTEPGGGDHRLRRALDLPLPDGTAVVLPPGSSIAFAEGAVVAVDGDGRLDLGTGTVRQLAESATVRLPSESIVGGPLQFARTPFVASFQAGWLKLNLCTVHIWYGDGDAGMARRNDEIRRLTKALGDRAASDHDSDADAYFVALGDFNIVGRTHETMESLRTNHFEVPDELTSVPGTNVRKDKFYDQIAVWTGESSRRAAYTKIRVQRAGVFDFFETVFTRDDEATYRPFMQKPGRPGEFYAEYERWRTYQMSDHLPMWVELQVDFGDEYLARVAAEIERRLDA